MKSALLGRQGHSTIESITRALAAGLVGTFVTGGALAMKNAIGVLPDVHVPQTLSTVIGTPGNVMAGGIAFFVIGTFMLSLAYAVISPRIPLRSPVIKGVLFGFAVWLTIMLIVMPVAGAGFFALHRSAAVPAAHLLLALLYGLVIAMMYASGSRELTMSPRQRSRPS